MAGVAQSDLGALANDLGSPVAGHLRCIGQNAGPAVERNQPGRRAGAAALGGATTHQGCFGRRRAVWPSGRVARRTASRTFGDAPGRLLVITTPSGLERFFEQFAALLPGPVDSETLLAVGHANWVEFVGPPVGVSDPL
jgi:hypothetical protein